MGSYILVLLVFRLNEVLTSRLQGFCLILSRLPTSRRRILEVVKTIEQEARKSMSIGGRYDIEAAA